MTRSISSVLRDAAERRKIPDSLYAALHANGEGAGAYYFAHSMRSGGYFFSLANEERSAFLYLCSLIAEDEE